VEAPEEATKQRDSSGSIEVAGACAD